MSTFFSEETPEETNNKYKSCVSYPFIILIQLFWRMCACCFMCKHNCSLCHLLDTSRTICCIGQSMLDLKVSHNEHVTLIERMAIVYGFKPYLGHSNVAVNWKTDSVALICH